MKITRVLVGERSTTVRNLVTRLLEDEEGISVVGTAADGEELLRVVTEGKADALVLDPDLPTLGGHRLIDAIGRKRKIPMVVVASKHDQNGMVDAFRAHTLGTVAMLPKPEVPDEWIDFGKVLGDALRHLGTPRGEGLVSDLDTDDTPISSSGLRFVAIGASTGGPGAVFDLLRAMGPSPPVGVAVVQHIAEGFESAFSEWLATELGVDVRVAEEGECLRMGNVRVAPPGAHLRLDPDGLLRLERGEGPVNGHRPAVDTLFRSLLAHDPGQVAAVLLSGMGSDGAEGMAEIRTANVLTIAQDEASSAVFGMPRAALESGGVALTLAPPQIGRLLARAGRRDDD